MSVSIVMATFNGEQYVAQQLDSILRQTVAPDEIIVRDDCSTDATLTIIEEISKTTEIPFRIVKGRENVGYAKNFIEAIVLAKCSHIFLSDQDDVWSDDKIESFLKVFEKAKSTLVVIGNQMIADEHLRPTGTTTIERLSHLNKRIDRFVHGCCTAFDARIKPLVVDLPDGLAHDDWIHMIASELDGRRVLKGCFQTYRRHAKSVAKSQTNDSLRPTASAGRCRIRRPSSESLQVVENLRKRLNWLGTLQRKLDDSQLVGIDPSQVRRAANRINGHIKALDRRIANISASGQSRFRIVLSAMRGDYGGFGGFGSALKDLLSMPRR